MTNCTSYIDNHTHSDIHSVSSMKQNSTGRHIGNIILAKSNPVFTNQPQYLLLHINTVCLSTEQHCPFDCLDFFNGG